MFPAGLAAADRVLGLLAQAMGRMDQAAAHFEDALVFCRKAGYRPELAWTCCDYADTLLQRNNRRPGKGHVPAGRVTGHLQGIGHAALEGAGAVPAGDFGSVG